MDLYLAHHNGKRPRFKVRFREYVETGTVFLEVKRKTNKERTRKCRIQVDKTEMSLSGESFQYIEEVAPLRADFLKPAIWTIFRRITLVGKNNPERITIDYELSFRQGDQEKHLPSCTICEVKRDSFSGHSAFIKTLREMSIFPGNSSKYCLGTILLNEDIKKNRFKGNILKIKKLENDYKSYPSAG
jgi:hypothetical protein